MQVCENFEKSILGHRYHQPHASRRLNRLQHQIVEAIDEKVRDCVYSFESIRCVICDQRQFETLANVDRYGLRHHVVICTCCGFIMANPRMTQPAYTAFYQSEYRPLYHGESTYPEQAIQNEINRGRLIYHYLQQHGVLSQLPKDALILEVGCGAGGILKVFADHGYEVMGIDIGESYLNYGREVHGLNLQVGWLGACTLEKAPSLILYSHVLEHILDVTQEIETLKQTLDDDGFLYVEVPGVRYLHRSNYDFMDSLQNAHIYYFTLSTLCHLMQQNSMELVCGDEYIRSVYRRAAQTEGAISFDNHFSSTVAYLRRMEWRRRFLPISPYALARRIKSRLCA